MKGAQCTTNDLLSTLAIDTPSLVIGIFMSSLDVHYNRVPSECVMDRFPMPPIRTMGLPMLWTEKGILDDLRIKPGSFGFMRDNERVVNRFFAPHMGYTYYVVQIADSDVNMIVPLKCQPTAWFNQNERFGQIIWGSMCVLVMPLDSRFKFKPLRKIGDHVECCNDPIVRVE